LFQEVAHLVAALSEYLLYLNISKFYIYNVSKRI
jgi:hypothetical protein